MSDLTAKTCVPCQGGVPPLTGDQMAPMVCQLSEWEVVAGHHLSRAFDFADFVTALAFVNLIGALAEEQGHHPDIHLTWGKVAIDIWTHKIDGLTESDFILAAKIDDLPR